MGRLKLFAALCFALSMFSSRAIAKDPPRVIHAFVALCDNEHQGIVKVGKLIGNGEDPFNNLYWGAMYGLKTHFRKSADWKLLQTEVNPREHVLERCVFRHARENVVMVAEGYDGRYISNTVSDFLTASAGKLELSVELQPEAASGASGESEKINAGGASALLVYIGHNGLMDFSFETFPKQADDRQREVIMLACAAKFYFEKPLLDAGAYPIVWTTGLMAPEAYTLKDALDGWVANEEDEKIRDRAARAYDRYQKCGVKAARNLLVTGFE